MTSPPFAAESAVRRLRLAAARRLVGRLHGDHAGLLPGPGSEPAEARGYVAGDDVRRIDWAATARTGALLVRQTDAERELEATLVLDLSASMAFGTARCEKRDLAIAVAAAVTQLVQGPGDRVGAVLLTPAGARRVPPRTGRAGRLAVLRAALDAAREDRAGPGLADALHLLARRPVRRGLVVVLSDLLGPQADGPPEWCAPLRQLAHRHDVVVVEVVDPRELALPDVGALRVVDPESGRQLEVHTTPALRRRFAAASAERRAATAAAVRSAGASHVVLRTDRDWLPELARFLTVRRRLAAAGATPARGPA